MHIAIQGRRRWCVAADHPFNGASAEVSHVA